MIFLKSKGLFKKIFVVIFSAIVFFGVSYIYLDTAFNNKTTSIDKKDYTVPYKNLPDNTGIALVLPDNSAVMLYFNFESCCINVVNIDAYDVTNDMYYGYVVDFTVDVDYQLIGGIVDSAGGVNIKINDQILRYTGVQVIDLISTGCDKTIKEQIITDIFNQISKNNFSKEVLLYIIENGNTNLSVVDYVNWLDYICEMFDNINFVN